MEYLTQIVLPLSLVFIMFSMGITLTIKDFTNITKYPKAFILGSFLQLVSLPLIAFGLSTLAFKGHFISAEVATGLVILAACPGGVVSNLMVHMGRGNTALSISLTSVISILSVFTIPFIVNFAHHSFLGAQNTQALPIGKTIIGVFIVTVVPVIAGMIFYAKRPELTKKFENLASKISSAFFVLIVVAIIIGKWNLLTSHLTSIGPLTFAFNTCVMLTALVAVKAFALNLKDQVAIIFECGLQNGTLSIMVTLTFLGNEMMMLPGAIYSIFMFMSGGLYLLFLRRHHV